MRNRLRTFNLLLTILTLALLSSGNYAQKAINLTLLEPLPISDFGDLSLLNDVTKAPRAFYIEIAPQLTGRQIALGFKLDWKDNSSASYDEIIYVRTAFFTAEKPVYYNDELGSGIIHLDKSFNRYNSDKISDNVKLGKPAGNYKFTIELYEKNQSSMTAFDTKEMAFLNPSQTLMIRTPEEGQTVDGGNVLVEWDDVVGATSYSVKANVRRRHNQSLEEALNSMSPLIRDKNVGNITSLNLRNILEREWNPGDEIVLQITANVPGHSTNGKLFSNIANFSINNPNSLQFSGNIAGLGSLLQSLNNGRLQSISQDILSGKLKITGIKSDDQKELTDSDVQTILQYLNANPDALIDIRFEQK